MNQEALTPIRMPNTLASWNEPPVPNMGSSSHSSAD